MREARMILPAGAMGLAAATAAVMGMAAHEAGLVVRHRDREPEPVPAYVPLGRRAAKRRDTKGVTWGKFKGSSAAKRPARLAQKRAKDQGRARRCARRVSVMTRGW